ncbi:hypothetical protein N7539_007713 [Penicillium diatomitis]|uniref:Uncharacterized protein n=1 Tax=Penicillium diatomitis TaxID=2819901 RepID=A0A9W9WU87_9EURO|nr:uncharacterized protein N7539_007713 [Penicillium diatomitis]KAJ5475426.1 hypothetical protein N7539_007713 [Penicillium diatomitis]
MDDDYVAEVLAREARDTSRKYQTEGLAAPTNDAPKPNTRFLRHLIKESESHNSALKRKEEKEARDRLRHLHGRPEERPVSKLAPSSQKSRDVPAGTSAADRKRRDEHLDRSRQDETEVDGLALETTTAAHRELVTGDGTGIA